MRLKSIPLLGSVVATALAAGCAQQPSKIAPAEVSRNIYDGANCKTLASELYTVETRLGQLIAAQKAEADKDAAWVAGGALLFFPAMVVAAAGEDHSAEIATLKGRKNAINAEVIASGCS